MTWCMVVGAGATVIANWFLQAPGQWVERVVPFFLSMCIGLAGSRRFVSQVQGAGSPRPVSR
jgi:hypothetical protein